MPAVIEVKYFNSFVLKKTLNVSDEPVWNGSFGIPQAIGGYDQNNVSTAEAQTTKNWVIEEARIRGGYNNTAAGYGAKAYLVEDEPNASIRFNSLIYSGIFNSTTGINNTNQFSVGEEITRSLDPANGSIQKLYAEDTNLIIFQENKVSNALIDKDAIYTAEGAGLTTTGQVVIGPVRAYAGEFGISRNPESFAVYGYRKYFTDKDRNAVLRLSADGITEISNYGMTDFFRDEFSTLDSYQTLPGLGKAVGMWDIYNKQYVVSLQPTNTDSYKTLAFDESVKGWTSFFNYKPALGTSLKNLFYTVDNGTLDNKNAGLYLHYSQNVNRAQFYGTTYDASIKFIFNPNVSMAKVFKTINYEGSNGWEVDSYVSDFTGISSVNTGGDFTTFSTTNTQDKAAAIYSYNQGAYDNLGNQYPSQLTPPINRAGFDRKENKYFANLVNNSVAAPGEIIYGDQLSGVKGYFVTVKMSTDSVTNYGKAKELFAVSSEYIESSY
jgi:hypothetical protein